MGLPSDQLTVVTIERPGQETVRVEVSQVIISGLDPAGNPLVRALTAGPLVAAGLVEAARVALVSVPIAALFEPAPVGSKAPGIVVPKKGPLQIVREGVALNVR